MLYESDREAVGRVVGLLDVRDVEVHRVALLDSNDVGREVAADRGHVDVHSVALALDAFFLGLDGVRIRLRR